MNGDVDLSRAIGRLEGKMDSLLEDFQDHREDHKASDRRIDTLEARADRQRGALAVLSLLAGVIGSVFTFMFKG